MRRTFIINLVMGCIMGYAWHMYYVIMSAIANNGQVIVPTWVINVTNVYAFVMTSVVIALPVTLVLWLVEVARSKKSCVAA